MCNLIPRNSSTSSSRSSDVCTPLCSMIGLGGGVISGIYFMHLYKISNLITQNN